jgi:hypothetical protein
MQCGPDGPIYSARRSSVNKMIPKESAAVYLQTHSLVIVAEGSVKKTG